jgi:hypothetical protein
MNWFGVSVSAAGIKDVTKRPGDGSGGGGGGLKGSTPDISRRCITYWLWEWGGRSHAGHAK